MVLPADRAWANQAIATLQADAANCGETPPIRLIRLHIEGLDTYREASRRLSFAERYETREDLIIAVATLGSRTAIGVGLATVPHPRAIGDRASRLPRSSGEVIPVVFVGFDAMRPPLDGNDATNNGDKCGISKDPVRFAIMALSAVFLGVSY